LTLSEVATLRAVLGALQRDSEAGITWSSVGAEVVSQVGSLDEYEGVIDHVRSIAGTEVAILFRELRGGQVKISFRSTGDADVASLARTFGGGGHAKAAGATVAGDLRAVRERVLGETRRLLGVRGET
jgi:phosphoesterase RecJ-like protein